MRGYTANIEALLFVVYGEFALFFKKIQNEVIKIPMTIRNLEKKDAPAVALLIPQLTKNIVEPEKLAGRIEALAVPGNYQYVVAEKDGAVVGFGGLAWYPIPSKGLVGWLEEVVVDEKFRGQGIAKALIAEILKIAEARQIKTIKPTSIDSVTNTLYEKFGFVQKDHQYFVRIIK